MNQRKPIKAIMLAKLLLAAPNGLTRKEMVVALLKANGRTYEPRLSGYGSVSFFTPGKDGVGGIYWNNDEADGRYRITDLGRALATSGTVATEEQKEAARKLAYAKRSAKWAAKRPQPTVTAAPVRKVMPMERWCSVEMPRDDWHVICGWLETFERADKQGQHIPTAAKDLAKLLRTKYFPV